VADHQLHPGRRSRVDHLLRVEHRRGHRLLHQDVLAGVQRPQADLGVALRCGGHQHRVHPVQYLVEVSARRIHRMRIDSCLAQPLDIAVHDRDSDVRHRIQHPDVLASPVAVSHDGYPDSI
jgi:hypothetical protein